MAAIGMNRFAGAVMAYQSMTRLISYSKQIGEFIILRKTRGIKAT